MAEHSFDDVVALARRLEAEGDLEGAQRAARIANDMRANQPNRATEFAKSAIEGGTMGLIGDEALAAGQSFLSGQDYDTALQSQRSQEAQFRGQNPWTDTAAEISGGVAAGVAASRIPALRGKVGRGLGGLVRAASAGAAGGGLYGFMEGEGGGMDRAAEVPFNAAIGGAGGGALYSAGNALGAIVEKAMSHGPARSVADMELNPDAARILAQTIEMDAPIAVDRLSRAGPGAVLADAGPNAMGLLDLAVNSPGVAAGQARQNITELSNEAAQNFTADLDANMGLPRGPKEIMAEAMSQTRGARQSAYSAAYDAPVDYASDAGQRLEGLLGRVPPEIVRRAAAMASEEGFPSQQFMATISEDGTTAFRNMPDVRQIDYIARALQDAPITQGRDMSGVRRGLAREIRATLDEINPDYKTARDEGANAITQREAVKLGRDMFTARMTREDVADAVAGYGPAQMRRMQQGARGFLDDQMARVRSALTEGGEEEIREAIQGMKLISSREARDKMEMLLGESQSNSLYQSVDRALIAMGRRAGISQNSKTAVRQMFMEFLEEGIGASTIEGLQSGGPVSATLNLLRGAVNDKSISDRQREVLSQVALALTRRDIDAQGAMARISEIVPRLEGAERAGNTVRQITSRANYPFVSVTGDE